MADIWIKVRLFGMGASDISLLPSGSIIPAARPIPLLPTPTRKPLGSGSSFQACKPAKPLLQQRLVSHRHAVSCSLVPFITRPKVGLAVHAKICEANIVSHKATIGSLAKTDKALTNLVSASMNPVSA